VRRCFDPDAWADYVYWFEVDQKMLRKINELIRDCTRSPFTGIGKPEPLRGELSGWWSRRISDEHRMVYRITGKGEAQTLEIIQLRFHYIK
jgi:toxin YoeB